MHVSLMGLTMLSSSAERVVSAAPGVAVLSPQVGQALSLSNPNPTAWQQAAAAGSAGQLLPPDFNPAGKRKQCL